MRISYYNSRMIQAAILGTCMLNNEVSQTQIDHMLGLILTGRLIGCPGPMNRCQPGLFKFDCTPLPDQWTTDQTFEQICLTTARICWHRANDRPIRLFWSGGIDSTVALVALILTNDRWQNQLEIYTTPHAVEQEYPWFYQNFLRQAQVSVLDILDLFRPSLYQDGRYCVDGSCGDQLWGSVILSELEGLYQEPWHKLYELDIFHRTVGSSSRIPTINYIDLLVSQFSSTVRTVSDLAWLLNFTHKWDYSGRKWMGRVRDASLFFTGMHSFFNHTSFQQWALSNPDIKIGRTFTSYKQPAKDFIYKFTRDNHYRVHKTQKSSVQWSFNPGTTWRDVHWITLMTAQGYYRTIEDDLNQDWPSWCFQVPE